MNDKNDDNADGNDEDYDNDDDENQDDYDGDGDHHNIITSRRMSIY